MGLDNNQIIDFLEYLVDLGKSPSTLAAYRSDLEAFQRYLDKIGAKGMFDLSSIESFHNVRQPAVTPNSRRRSTIAIKQFLKFLDQKGHAQGSIADNLIIPKREEKFPNYLTAKNIESLFAAVDQTLSEQLTFRNKALLALFCFEGLKTSEAICLNWADFSANETQSSSSLRIGMKYQRVIFLDEKTSDYIKQLKTLKPNAKGPMFLGYKGPDGAQQHGKISRHGIKFFLAELGQKTGILPLNGEILRHYAVSYLAQKMSQPNDIMNHLGIKQPGIVKTYFNFTRSNSHRSEPNKRIPQK